MVMDLSVSVTSMANEDSSITVSGVASSSHTFSAYQIFSGTVEGNELTSIAWGSGVKEESLLTALQSLSVGEQTPFSACTTAAQVAAVLADSTEDADLMKAFAETVAGYLADTATATTSSGTESSGTYTYTISNLADGYYIVVDTIESSAADSASRYIVKLAGEATVNTKAVVTTSKKEIVSGDSTSKGTSASIGDSITFKLSATIPSDLSSYDTYKIIFHDTLSANLTLKAGFAAGDLTVYAGSTQLTEGFTVSVEGQKLTITFDDVKAYAGETITVTYSATLGDNATYSTTETNTLNVEYSNDPNNEGSTGNTNSGTESTTDDKVYIHTFKLVVEKTDAATNKALNGATFTLYKKNSEGEYEEVKKIEGTSLSEFTFDGLGEGDYKLEETSAPYGYNKADDIKFTISATYADDGSTVTVSSGNDSVSVDSKTLSTTVANASGAVLPGTGGMGTAVFYVAGALIMICAAVVLIARKRMGKAE